MKLKWTKGSIARDASQEEGPTVDIWTTECNVNYSTCFVMVLPTSVIHGNDDFGSKDCRWVYFIHEIWNRPYSRKMFFGHTSVPYSNPNTAKSEARKFLEEMEFYYGGTDV